MNKLSKVLLSTAVFAVVFSLAGLINAATVVDLGTASNFAVLAGSTITNTGSSVINGDLGLDPGLSITGFPPGTLNGTQHLNDAVVISAKTDLVTAYNDAAGRTPVSTVATELGGTTKYAGVYNSADGTFGITGNLTLDAQGDSNAIFVFKASTTLITAGSSNVILANGAQSKNVFWQVGSSATLGASSIFKGNILALTSVTLTTGASVEGRVFARNGAVTMDTNIITVPATLRVVKTVVNNNGGTAVASAFDLHVKLSGTDVALSPAVGVASPGKTYTLNVGTYVVSEDANVAYTQSFSGDCNSSGSVTLTAGADKTCIITNDDIASLGRTVYTGTINVLKRVINDNGGTKLVTDFPLFVNGTAVVSGVSNSSFLTPNTFNVTETTNSQYTQSFSGDCDTNGNIVLSTGDIKFCIITNDDLGSPAIAPPVPPHIDVVKVPNPLSLPSGPGSVTYTYTLRNIGTVPVTDITMVGDTCSPIVLISGDSNSDGKLDVNETWVHTCTTTLTETHTNTVVATGWANGISATDIASATVVVGVSAVPPLIHVTKVPSPLTLTSGGGMVTFTKNVTNPGTVALSNVSLSDDKCSAVSYISGDVNSDSKLDTNETWTYTCSMNVTKTITNTVTASGDANGLTARDFAIATVVVAIPKLPNTGIDSNAKNIPWNVIALIGILVLAMGSVVVLSKKQTV